MPSLPRVLLISFGVPLVAAAMTETSPGYWAAAIGLFCLAYALAPPEGK